MGIKAFIGKVLLFSHTEENGDKVSEVTVNPGGGANVSGVNYSPIGDDSQPLSEDFAVAVPISGTGVNVVIGYADPKNDQKSRAGEKRIYARDNSGTSKVELWLKKDGSAILSNDNGTVELKVNGDVDANGATIDTTGDVTTLEGVSLRTHVHPPAAPSFLDDIMTLNELSVDPVDPGEGSAVMWMSDGTGTGDDGDILMKITAGSVTKTITIVDFSMA